MSEHAATERVSRWLAILAAGELDSWDGIAGPDLVMDVPFAPPPMGGVMTGAAACKAAVGQLWSTMASFEFHDVKIFATAEAGVVFATARSAATTTWGREYQNNYVFQIELRDGLIVRHTEYFNPLPVLEVFGEHLSAAG